MGIQVLGVGGLSKWLHMNFSLYTGREETKTDKGLGYDVVMKLIGPLFEKGYKLFCDNFYTSPVLAKDRG
jgi:hypothetical protein